MATVHVSVHEHPLTEIGRSGWSCDGPGCRNNSGPRFNCSCGCNYDLCAQCVQKYAAVVEVVPVVELPPVVIGPGPHLVDNHDHPLELCERGGWSCDGRCGCNSGDRFRCRDGCDYDLCSECLVAHLLPAGTPIPCPQGRLDDCRRAVEKTESNIKQASVARWLLLHCVVNCNVALCC